MFFSVIIPIYNNLSYIRRGIDCLMSQTFTDFEVIMVDDSSTDGSGSLCDEIAKSNSKIKIIHQPNMGAGGARNTGIKNAQGDYLAFFDIDDLIEPDWLLVIHNYIKRYQPQVLMYGYKEKNTLWGTENTFTFELTLFKDNNTLRENYVEKISGIKFNNGFVWNKIYEREFILQNNIRFENLRIQQDEVFNLSIYPLVDRVLLIPDILYNYFVYYKGNTSSGYIPGRLNIYRRVRDAFNELSQNWNICDNRLNEYIYNRFYNSLLHDLRFNLYHSESGLSKKERDIKLLEIMNAKDVNDCIKKLKLNKKSFFDRQYIKAINYHSVNYFNIIIYVNNIVNRFKYLIRYKL